jgi:putative ABC transport system permease protein
LVKSSRALNFWLKFKTPPLALQNVLHGRARSAAAIAGIGFAVVMVILELGFLEAVRIAASVNYDNLDFDVALVSPQFEQFYDPGTIPLRRLVAAEGVPAVVAARPLYARMNLWRCPPYPLDGDWNRLEEESNRLGALSRWWLGSRRPRPLQRRELIVLGIDLDKNPFVEPIRSQVEAMKPQLRLDGRVLMSTESNLDFGWSQRGEFDGWELGQQHVDVVGGFDLPRSFGADAAILCDDFQFAKAFGMVPRSDVEFGLVKIRPGSLEQATEQLKALMPADIQVLTRAEIYRIEADYWVNQTATGKIFAFGVFIGMIVAAVVVYQVLSNDVRRRLPEYATLKAIGHGNWFLGRTILLQGLIYSFSAYVPALVASYFLYRATERLANIPMRLTLSNIGIVLVLTVGFSLVSGLLTLRKLRSADPAELY